MSRSAAFFASLLVSLGRPAWWLLALAGFLVRGGILLAVLSIVDLPSPLGLANLVAPVVERLAFGLVDTVVISSIVAVALGLAAWLVVGGLVGAATDLALIREAAAAAVDEGVGGRLAERTDRAPAGRRRGLGLLVRILAVRLLAQVPLGLVLAVGAVGVGEVTYVELTNPADVATPLFVRVAIAAARPIAAIVVAWFLGELVGGIAARRVVLAGDGIARALRGAVEALVRRPRSTLVPTLVLTVPLVVILGGTLGGARIAWLRTDAALVDPATDGPALVVTLMTFIAIWLAALTLIGLLAAARSAALTFEEVRSRAGPLDAGVSPGDPVERDVRGIHAPPTGG